MPSCMALCSPLGPAHVGLPPKQTETEIVSILAPRRWDAFPRDSLLASKRGAGEGNSLGLSTNPCIFPRCSLHLIEHRSVDFYNKNNFKGPEKP